MHFFIPKIQHALDVDALQENGANTLNYTFCLFCTVYDHTHINIINKLQVEAFRKKHLAVDKQELAVITEQRLQQRLNVKTRV